MTRAAPWHRRAERGSPVAMRFTVWLYRRIGRRATQLVLVPIVAYFFVTGAAARRASRDYLRRVLRPEIGTVAPVEPELRHVFRHFLAFGTSILDRVGFWLGRHEDFRLEIRGAEHLDRIAREGRGAIVLGSHLGSFDAMRMAGGTSPIPVNVLMYTEHAQRINALFDSLAAISGEPASRVRVVPIRPHSFDHVLAARACIERGEVVAILADRIPPGEARHVSRVKFLGGVAALSQGPFRLAAALGVPVVFMVALRTADAAYTVDVAWLTDRIDVPRARRRDAIDALCQAYADRLAEACRRAPYQWFNFFEFWLDGEVDRG